MNHFQSTESTSLDTEAATLLNNPSLLAKILSYNITNTADFASFRLISKKWNQRVLPYVLKSSGLVKICYPPRYGDEFIDGILGIEEDNRNGQLFVFGEDVAFDNASTTWFEKGGKTESVLLVSDIQSSKILDSGIRDDGRFRDLATMLTETKSFKEFEKMATESIGLGLFLLVSEREHLQKQKVFSWSKFEKKMTCYSTLQL
eukprot:scaffold2719_cov266-Chaetoceros_neogracile.AAC.16